MNLIENCVVCEKYLQTIALQEQGMCNKCEDATNKVCKEIREEKNKNYG